MQCAIAVFDLVPRGEQGDKFKSDTMNLAFKTLTEKAGSISFSEISLQLVTIKCLVRFSRKFKKEQLEQFNDQFDSILEPLLELV